MIGVVLLALAVGFCGGLVVGYLGARRDTATSLDEARAAGQAEGITLGEARVRFEAMALQEWDSSAAVDEERRRWIDALRLARARAHRGGMVQRVIDGVLRDVGGMER